MMFVREETVNVEQPVVMVEAPQVEVASPTVNVEAPKVEVTNTIERKLVRKVVKRDELGRIVEVIEEFMEGE
jgi:phage baseplate assembly protein gpV